jgi:two-component system, chemotaxis family, sensor histidine kinase and response regulator WspE
MITQTPDELNELPLSDLFRSEVEVQTAAITEGLLALEQDPSATELLRELMRGAHSLKGAARIVNRDPAVRVAHAMEDCFVAAQHSPAGLPAQRIDNLLQGVDLLTRIANLPDDALAAWESDHQNEIDAFVSALRRSIQPPGEAMQSGQSMTQPQVTKPAEPASRDIRVAAESINRLLGLAGESVVASHWLDGFGQNLLRFKRMQEDVVQAIRGFCYSLGADALSEASRSQFSEWQQKLVAAQDFFLDQLEEFEWYERRYRQLANRSYQEVLDCRMRPFSDGIRGLSRMVRDEARSLGKEVRFEILGETTPVDREILKSIETILGHLLRNAVDHGIGTPAERQELGKPATGSIRVEASHSGGMLVMEVSDDGRGIDPEAIRRMVVEKGLTTEELAIKLTEPELLEFLFLPGFTMKEVVTEISGRGVGLDVVQTTIKEVGGSVRISSQLGQGTKFQLQLPLTLSVLRTLVVEIAGEPYAFPITRIHKVLKLARESLESVEGREHFTFGEEQVGLVSARQVLGLEESSPTEPDLSVVVIGESHGRCGLVVDRFLGERELVIRALDPRLGKVKDISAAALTADQSPVLIIDVEDIVRSIDNLVSGGRLTHVSRHGALSVAKRQKCVLVVDDSLTVRELERKLIESKGYKVETAVDGMDAWNAVRTGQYDLIVTDVDMPRLDGIELVTLIKKDLRLNSLPTLIVSYKDREEDRCRGLDAGADYYLTKASFHDATLLHAVQDLIGEPVE